MKLVRFGANGEEKPAVLIDEKIYDVSAHVDDYNEAFFAGNGLEQLAKLIAEKKDDLNVVDPGVRLGPPVARPSKIVCVGLNYSDHAKETGATPPTEPVIFLKATSSYCGPNDNIMLPRNSQKTDWEVELAVIIGKKARYVSEENAMDHVAGYCLHNDVSEREFQLERGGTWDKGKGCDTFAPMGPFMATPDEIGDVNQLTLWLTLNGEKMQDGNTANFLFSVAKQIAYLSEFMTLLPGDIISTGTPAGVGLGMSPNVYLKAGDVVELGITGLGTSRQEVVAFSL